MLGFIINCIYSVVIGVNYNSFCLYDTIFTLFSSIFLFLAFSTIRVNNSILNKIASYSFAVYLFHMGPYLWEYITTIFSVPIVSGWEYCMLFLLIPICMYVCAIMVESARRLLFAKFENYMSKKLCSFSYVQKIELLLQNF